MFRGVDRSLVEVNWSLVENSQLLLNLVVF